MNAHQLKRAACCSGLLLAKGKDVCAKEGAAAAHDYGHHKRHNNDSYPIEMLSGTHAQWMAAGF
jgi:hypothetical protein